MDIKTYRILIFGGTTEGRELSEYCANNDITADVSVATDYGASLLPLKINKHIGKLDAFQITELLEKNGYSMVVDATHPYAVEATNNIKKACNNTHTLYYRLLRENDRINKEPLNMEQIIERLNTSDKTVLSTLGSRSLSELTKINNYKNRVWLRLLPADDIIDKCEKLGFDINKVILEKGPFSVEENIEHIIKSGAEMIITKDSGSIGGFNEKKIAADKCRIGMLTLARPVEEGHDFASIIKIIEEGRP